MIAEYGHVARPAGLPPRPAVVPYAVEGEYLARDHGAASSGDREGPDAGPRRPSPAPLRSPYGTSVDVYLQTGRPWSDSRQGRHVDLYA